MAVVTENQMHRKDDRPTRHPAKKERELLACEARLRTLMAKSPYGMLVAEPDGMIIFANPAAAAIFGCHETELPGRRFELPAAPGKTFETTMERPDGQTIIVETWDEEAQWDGEKAWVICLSDITERRRNEHELRKLCRAVQESPSIVMITDASGTIEFVNPKFTKVTGYTLAEVAGRNPRILKSGKVPPEVHRELWETILVGREWRGEMINRKKNGELYWEFAAISSIKDADGKITHFIAVTEDITERKRAEEALRFSEARYRALYRDNPTMIATLDADLTMLSVNPFCASQLGYSIDELEGRSVLSIFHEDDRPAVAQQLDNCLQHPHQVHRWQFRKIRKDGELLWVEEIAQAVYDLNGMLNIMVVCQDVTERRRAEEALRENEERYRRLYNETPVMLHSIDQEGRLVSVSDYWLETLEYTRSEVLGRKTTEFLTEASRRLAEEIVLPEFFRTGSCKDVPYQIVKKSGEILDILLSATAERDGEGKLARSVAVMVDVTARKRAEEEVEKLNTDLAARAAELESANRELETFSYSASHDLRKPLTVINGYCQIIHELCGASLDEQCLGYLQEINDATLRMNELIDALLRFSAVTRSELHRETVDLSSLAKTVAAELALTEPGRRATFRIADGLTADGDTHLLRVVLENLVGNAWKYTAVREEAVIEFGVTDIDGKPTWFVRDNGTGFAMVDAEKLFLPFQRLADADEVGGHGIGLATVQRIVQRHGGRVWAEGEPGKGATFWFTL